MTARWVGIDEAGYGPNLGPLVMTAVVAEAEEEEPVPDLWRDRAATVCRAGEASGSDRLAIDDSKRLYQSGAGFDLLEAATFAALGACGHTPPTGLVALLDAVGGGTLEEVELAVWIEAEDLSAMAWPPRPVDRRLEGARWRL